MRVPGVPFIQGRNSYPDRDGKKYGIAIHCTANTASDTNEAKYAQRRTDGVSSHFYFDIDSATQSLETSARAGHAGSNHGNENGIAYEITGLTSWTRSQWLSKVDWDEVGRVTAYILKNDSDFKEFQIRRASVDEMKKNPRVQAFYGHDDMRRAWGGTTHTDPGPNFPWDHLITVVKDHMGKADSEGEGFLNALTPKQQVDVWFNLANMGPGGGRRLVNYVEDNTALLNQILANQKIIMGQDFVNEQEIVRGVVAELHRFPLEEAARIIKNGFGVEDAKKLAELLAQ